MNAPSENSPPSLPQFILANTRQIVAEWEAFTKSMPIGSALASNAIRHDVEPMLRFIAVDMETAQSASDQIAKSQGRIPRANVDEDSVAQKHSARRLDEGFDLNQMVSEYRALRATVIRLWTQSSVAPLDRNLDQIVRFNETIDQLIAESVQRFTELVDRSRNLVLGVLSHDLRNPLSSVLLSSVILRRDPNLTANSASAVERIERSAERMRSMVSDLLDFTRTHMGMRLPVHPSEANLVNLVRQVVEELRSAHPRRIITVDMSGNLCGQWDAGRLSQLLSNLVGNAIQHGDANTVVGVKAVGTHDVEISIHSHGPTISEHDARTIFDPLVRGLDAVEGEPLLGSMGLGLFIAREIAVAHGGTVDVTSSDEAGTTFTVKLPREVRSSVS